MERTATLTYELEHDLPGSEIVTLSWLADGYVQEVSFERYNKTAEIKIRSSRRSDKPRNAERRHTSEFEFYVRYKDVEKLRDFLSEYLEENIN